MMKEYKFEPQSQMIDVLEGATINVELKSVRVAYRYINKYYQVENIGLAHVVTSSLSRLLDKVSHTKWHITPIVINNLCN